MEKNIPQIITNVFLLAILFVLVTGTVAIRNSLKIIEENSSDILQTNFEISSMTSEIRDTQNLIYCKTTYTNPVAVIYCLD